MGEFENELARLDSIGTFTELPPPVSYASSIISDKLTPTLLLSMLATLLLEWVLETAHSETFPEIWLACPLPPPRHSRSTMLLETPIFSSTPLHLLFLLTTDPKDILSVASLVSLRTLGDELHTPSLLLLLLLPLSLLLPLPLDLVLTDLTTADDDPCWACLALLAKTTRTLLLRTDEPLLLLAATSTLPLLLTCGSSLKSPTLDEDSSVTFCFTL